MKKFLIISILLIVLCTTFFHVVNAVAISEETLKYNIEQINYNMQVDSKRYITELVDDNGNVPSYNYTYKANGTPIGHSFNINSLKAYDGKIFMGLGDYQCNTAPTSIIYYDTKDGKVKTSGTVWNEEVLSFRIIDDELYTTGADPRDNSSGIYYKYNKETNSWETIGNVSEFVHVYDIVKFDNKLFVCGSTYNTESQIQYSNDGVNFEDVPIYVDGEKIDFNNYDRFYGFAIYNETLYAFHPTYDTSEVRTFRNV